MPCVAAWIFSVKEQEKYLIFAWRLTATCFQGLGVALVPEISMEILKRDLDVEWYHLLECPVTWDVNIYYREDAYLGTMERDLIQMAEDVFGKRRLWKGI